MTPLKKDKIVALCEKWGLKELNLTKGLYLSEDNSGITVNLRGDNPVVGVTIAGELCTEGHGNLRVEDYQREVEAIMKSSSKKPHSSRNEKKQEKEIKGGQESSLLGIPDNIAPPAKQGSKTADSHSAGATTSPPKLQKAKCKECNTEFELTLDAAQKIFEEYEGIYCMKCRSKEAKHEKKEAKKEGDNKIMETTPKTCTSCGLELSPARALECFQKDPQKPTMICEDCEEVKTEVITKEQAKKTQPDARIPVLTHSTQGSRR